MAYHGKSNRNTNRSMSRSSSPPQKNNIKKNTRGRRSNSSSNKPVNQHWMPAKAGRPGYWMQGSTHSSSAGGYSSGNKRTTSKRPLRVNNGRDAMALARGKKRMVTNTNPKNHVGQYTGGDMNCVMKPNCGDHDSHYDPYANVELTQWDFLPGGTGTGAGGDDDGGDAPGKDRGTF